MGGAAGADFWGLSAGVGSAGPELHRSFVIRAGSVSTEVRLSRKVNLYKLNYSGPLVHSQHFETNHLRLVPKHLLT